MSDIQKSNSDETYLLKECDKLNNELENLLTEIRSREKYSLTILAVLSAWIFKEKIDNPGCQNLILNILGFVPLVDVLLYGISAKYLYKNIIWIGEYLMKIENHFLQKLNSESKKDFGWEKHFNSKKKESKFVEITVTIWIFQLVLAISVCLLNLFL